MPRAALAQSTPPLQPFDWSVVAVAKTGSGLEVRARGDAGAATIAFPWARDVAAPDCPADACRIASSVQFRPGGPVQVVTLARGAEVLAIAGYNTGEDYPFLLGPNVGRPVDPDFSISGLSRPGDEAGAGRDPLDPERLAASGEAVVVRSRDDDWLLSILGTGRSEGSDIINAPRAGVGAPTFDWVIVNTEGAAN